MWEWLSCTHCLPFPFPMTPFQFSFPAFGNLWRWISQKRYHIYRHRVIEILIETYIHDLRNSVTSNDLEWSFFKWLSKIFNDTKRDAVSLRQLSFLFQVGFVSFLAHFMCILLRTVGEHNILSSVFVNKVLSAFRPRLLRVQRVGTGALCIRDSDDVANRLYQENVTTISRKQTGQKINK